MEKQAQKKPVEDIGFLSPKLRRKMGLELSAIFEDVGRTALEKVKNRATDVIAEEIAAFSDDLAKRIRDDLGKKGIDTAVEYITPWAEAVAADVLAHASETVTEKIVAGMRAHFPVKEEGQEKKAVTYKGALYVESMSNEPMQRALERIEDLKTRGQDPRKGTILRLNKTENPGKIQGIWLAAKKFKWKDVEKAAAEKFRDIVGKPIHV